MHSIVIFASGAGTNTSAIIEFFKKVRNTKVSLIVTNNPKAGVLDIAKKEEIPFLIVDKKTIKETLIIEQLEDFKPSLIVLAGFLWKLPTTILNRFPNKVINIHPALLPKYGGKGMYGNNVHKAVLDAKEKESGITIHYVNEQYDKGDIILQARCKTEGLSTPDELAAAIHKMEHYFFSRTIQYLLQSN